MRRFVAGLIVIAILGGAGYYAYSKNWGPTDWVRRMLGVSGDSKISSSVTTALSLSKRLAPFNITAQTEDGVNSVSNDLTVRNPQAPSEPASANPTDPNLDLAKKVKFNLYETGAFDTLTLDVHAQDGNVTLTGSVRTRAEQVLATFVAQGVPGVKKVNNQLQLIQSPRR